MGIFQYVFLTLGEKHGILAVLPAVIQLKFEQKGEPTVLQLDRRDPRPVYEQVVEGIESLIARGVLRTDEQLPSVRQMAMDLSVNPNTIQKAYSELLNRGVIYSVRGRGNFVADDSVVRGRMLWEIQNKMEKLLQQAREIGATEEELHGLLRSLMEVN